MKQHILTLLLVLSAGTCSLHAQTVIEGMVLNAEGKTVDAYVTVGAQGSGTILSIRFQLL